MAERKKQEGTERPPLRDPWWSRRPKDRAWHQEETGRRKRRRVCPGIRDLLGDYSEQIGSFF